MYPLYFFLIVLALALFFSVRVGRRSVIAGVLLGIVSLPGVLFVTMIYSLFWTPQAAAICDPRYAAIYGGPPCAPGSQSLEQLLAKPTPLN